MTLVVSFGGVRDISESFGFSSSAVFCEWLEASFSVSSVVWGSCWLLGFRSGFIYASFVSFKASLRVSRGIHLGIRSSFAFGVSL